MEGTKNNKDDCSFDSSYNNNHDDGRNERCWISVNHYSFSFINKTDKHTIRKQLTHQYKHLWYDHHHSLVIIICNYHLHHHTLSSAVGNVT